MTDTDFPEDASPELRVGKLSALCSFGMTPRLLTGTLRQLLLQHFVDPQNIYSHNVRQWLKNYGVWAEGENSGLYVESLARWRPELTQSRPAVVLKAGDWNWQRVGIGDQAGCTWEDGTRFFTGLWQGTHTIFVLGNETGEVEILATEIAKVLLWFSPLLQDQLQLHRFVMVSVGALRTLKDALETYVVPIVVAYTKEESWSLQEEARDLNVSTSNVDELLNH